MLAVLKLDWLPLSPLGSSNCCLWYGLCHDLFRCHYFLLFNETSLCKSSWFLSSSVSYVRLHSFYLWQHVMLLTSKDYSPSGSLWLCCLLYVLGVIYESICICTSMCLYIIMIYTDGMIMSMCLHLLMATSGLVYYMMNADCIVMCVYCVSMRIL